MYDPHTFIALITILCVWFNQSVVEWIQYSASEIANSDSISGRVKPKIKKFGIHSFPALRSVIKGIVL